jgi:hypothetical protein
MSIHSAEESHGLQTYTAFEGDRCIESGELRQVVTATKKAVDRHSNQPVLIFDDATSELLEIDFRGSLQQVLARLSVTPPPPEPEAEEPRGRGRPKLGVTAREVTLLPRHWEWLNLQPGGASVALRKLVEKARTANEGRDRVRLAQEVCYRFMSAMAGDKPGFEEASRALFAGNAAGFAEQTKAWPEGVRNHVKRLAAGAWEAELPVTWKVLGQTSYTVSNRNR